MFGNAFFIIFPLSILAALSTDSQTIKARYMIEGTVSIDDQNFEWLRNTRVVIGDELESTYLGLDGTFKFDGLLPGEYLVSVVSPNHYFRPVQVKIATDGTTIAIYIGELNGNLRLPLVFSSNTRANYRIITDEYNIFALLNNPLLILVAVSFGLVKLQSFLSGYTEGDHANEAKSLKTTKKSIMEAIEWVFPKETS